MAGVDADTWMNRHTLNAALRAAGSVPQPVDLVMKEAVQAVFCNVRPPHVNALNVGDSGFEPLTPTV